MEPRNTPPVAVRVARPFASVDELLAAESNLFTRTGIVLVGAPSRPQGVVIRFEICLRDGTPVMRGEGRVVGHRPPSSSDEGALMLRFTRLDVKSKELLDRAVAMREERRSLMPPAPPPAAKAEPPRPPTPPPPRPKTPAPPPPPSSVPPPTDRHDTETIDAQPVHLDSADLLEEAVEDATEQAPPVAPIEAPVEAAPIEAPQVEPTIEAATHGPKEKAPIPSPSPGKVPVPHPQPVHEPPPHRHAPEATPHPEPREHFPPPTPSPSRPARAGEFRMSIDPAQRESALDSLRERAKRLGVR